MHTMKLVHGDDRRIALEAIGRAAAAAAERAGGDASQQACEVAEAMLAGTARLDGLKGPVVLLRGAWDYNDLADELEALAAECRQRAAEMDAFMKSAEAAFPCPLGDEAQATRNPLNQEGAEASPTPSESPAPGA